MHEIGLADLDLLRGGAGVEVVVGDALAVFQRVDLLPAGDVEQHAAAHQLVLGVLDAELAHPIGVDGGGVMPVVHLVVVEDVPQRIPVRGRLDRHVERIVGVEQPALPAGQRVGAGGEHGVDRVPALAEQAPLRPALPQRHAEREHLAALDQLGGRDDIGRRDVVERADLVVLAPAAPVRQRLEGLIDRLLRHLDVAAARLLGCRHRLHPRSLGSSPSILSHFAPGRVRIASDGDPSRHEDN